MLGAVVLGACFEKTPAKTAADVARGGARISSCGIGWDAAMAECVRLNPGCSCKLEKAEKECGHGEPYAYDAVVESCTHAPQPSGSGGLMSEPPPPATSLECSKEKEKVILAAFKKARERVVQAREIMDHPSPRNEATFAKHRDANFGYSNPECAWSAAMTARDVAELRTIVAEIDASFAKAPVSACSPTRRESPNSRPGEPRYVTAAPAAAGTNNITFYPDYFDALSVEDAGKSRVETSAEVAERQARTVQHELVHSLFGFGDVFYKRPGVPYPQCPNNSSHNPDSIAWFIMDLGKELSYR